MIDEKKLYVVVSIIVHRSGRRVHQQVYTFIPYQKKIAPKIHSEFCFSNSSTI